MAFSEEFNKRHRILIITYRPIQSVGGAYQRVQGLITALARYWAIKVLSIGTMLDELFPEAKPQSSERRNPLSLTPRWVRRADNKTHHTVMSRICDEIQTFGASLVILSSPFMLAWITRRLGVPTILDAYDIMWVLNRRKSADAPARLKTQIHVAFDDLIARRYERIKYRIIDELWVCSEIDMDYAHQNGWRGRTRIVPNFYGPLKPQDCVPVHTPFHRTILFVGSMGGYPNIHGIRWFLTHCWQHIRTQIPDVRLRIAGQWDDRINSYDFAQEGVEILGFVEDLSAVWQSGDISICPILLGTGTRIKIIESWARGLPVVSTSVGIEGLAAINGVHALIEDEPMKFADAVVRLLRDDNLRAELGSAGHRLMQALYTWDAVGALAVHNCWELLH